MHLKPALALFCLFTFLLAGAVFAACSSENCGECGDAGSCNDANCVYNFDEGECMSCQEIDASECKEYDNCMLHPVSEVCLPFDEDVEFEVYKSVINVETQLEGESIALLVTLNKKGTGIGDVGEEPISNAVVQFETSNSEHSQWKHTKTTNSEGNVKSDKLYVLDEGEGCDNITISYAGDGQIIRGVDETYEYCPIQTNFVYSMANQGCLPMIVILGFLLGGMLVTGRNPLSAFDFTTPRFNRGSQRIFGQSSSRKSGGLQKIMSVVGAVQNVAGKIQEVKGEGLSAAKEKMAEKSGNKLQQEEMDARDELDAEGKEIDQELEENQGKINQIHMSAGDGKLSPEKQEELKGLEEERGEIMDRKGMASRKVEIMNKGSAERADEMVKADANKMRMALGREGIDTEGMSDAEVFGALDKVDRSPAGSVIGNPLKGLGTEGGIRDFLKGQFAQICPIFGLYRQYKNTSAIIKSIREIREAKSGLRDAGERAEAGNKSGVVKPIRTSGESAVDYNSLLEQSNDGLSNVDNNKKEGVYQNIEGEENKEKFRSDLEVELNVALAQSLGGAGITTPDLEKLEEQRENLEKIISETPSEDTEALNEQLEETNRQIAALERGLPVEVRTSEKDGNLQVEYYDANGKKTNMDHTDVVKYGYENNMENVGEISKAAEENINAEIEKYEADVTTYENKVEEIGSQKIENDYDKYIENSQEINQSANELVTYGLNKVEDNVGENTEDYIKAENIVLNIARDPTSVPEGDTKYLENVIGTPAMDKLEDMSSNLGSAMGENEQLKSDIDQKAPDYFDTRISLEQARNNLDIAKTDKQIITETLEKYEGIKEEYGSEKLNDGANYEVAMEKVNALGAMAKSADRIAHNREMIGTDDSTLAKKLAEENPERKIGPGDIERYKQELRSESYLTRMQHKTNMGYMDNIEKSKIDEEPLSVERARQEYMNKLNNLVINLSSVAPTSNPLAKNGFGMGSHGGQPMNRPEANMGQYFAVQGGGGQGTPKQQ